MLYIHNLYIINLNHQGIVCGHNTHIHTYIQCHVHTQSPFFIVIFVFCTELQTHGVTASALDQLSVLTSPSLEGIHFTGPTPQDWRQISLHQYNRGTPSHLLEYSTKAGNEKAWQTKQVWLYQPPSDVIASKSRSMISSFSFFVIYNYLLYSLLGC